MKIIGEGLCEILPSVKHTFALLGLAFIVSVLVIVNTGTPAREAAQPLPITITDHTEGLTIHGHYPSLPTD